MGPRQVGKTTLARAVASQFESPTFFDLENPASLARLSDPMLALGSLQGLIIIDEVQHAPDLFKALRVLADEPGQTRKFHILTNGYVINAGNDVYPLTKNVTAIGLSRLREIDF